MSWWVEYFADVDSGDFDNMARWFAPDIVMQFASYPQVLGKEAVCDALRAWLDRWAGLSHELGPAAIEGNHTLAAAEVTYRLHNGATITIPAATLFEKSDKGITRLNIYIDVAPLAEAAATQAETI